MMHDDQIAIDADIVRQVISDQFPQYSHEAIVPVRGAGTENAIFRIGRDRVARFPLRAMDPVECAVRLDAEAAAMTAFAQHAPFPTPRPIAHGRPGALYPLPWALQTWIEGDVASPDGLASSRVFAQDLITLIVSLRAVDTQGRRFDEQGRGGSLPDHDDWVELCLKNSTALLDTVRLRALWRRLRDLPRSGPDVMSHRDLIPGNLLVKDERLIGILDAGKFGPADPALDLVAAWHLLDPARREWMRLQLGSSDIEWQRGAAWAFEQAIGLVWYYENSNPTMSSLGRSTLSRLVDDLDR